MRIFEISYSRKGDTRTFCGCKNAAAAFLIEYCPLVHYLPRHKVDVVGNDLMATVHGICTVSLWCPVSVCLQILNSVNISGMDEAHQIWQMGQVWQGLVKNFP